MIVPDFWAEARVQRPRRNGQGQVTVRRFGWSETSQPEAQRMAEERARAALDRIVAGEKQLRRSEPKVPYNGAEGVPIREEVLGRLGDVVITRNSYGARCLNTPDVLFADVDFETEPGSTLLWAVLVLALAAGTGVGVFAGSVKMGIVATLAALLLGYPFALFLRRQATRLRGGPVKVAWARVRRWVRRRRDWHLRLYETPAGLRVLATHRTFDPRSEEVMSFFKALGVDPVYARMCRHQACFRARLTAKPWRIGLPHITPRPGVWPVNPARRAERDGWIRDYEQVAAGFAACRLVEEMGSGFTDPKAATVRDLHDRLSQATSGRQTA